MLEQKKAHVYQSPFSGVRSIDLVYSDEHGELQIVLGHVDIVTPKIFDLMLEAYEIVYGFQPSGTRSDISELTKKRLDEILAKLTSERFDNS